MPTQFPSIKDFFQPDTSSKRSNTLVSFDSDSISDGFTAEEMDTQLDLDNGEHWAPSQEYDHVSITDLIPGPRRVTFIARVVNFYNQPTPSKKPQAAKGCQNLLVKDDTAAITIRLWYAEHDYTPHLGQLVTIWTVHIHTPKPESSLTTSTTHPPAALITNIFPERDRHCFLLLHTDSSGPLGRTPLGYRSNNQPLQAAVTLKAFIDSGADLPDARILVSVKVIGTPETRTSPSKPDSPPYTSLDIGIHDETAEAILTLYGPLVTASASTSFHAANTILLLSYPGWRSGSRICLKARTQVDVDPNVPEADWLRRWAMREGKGRDKCNEVWDESVFDVSTFESAPIRLRFTLADLDEFVRASPTSPIIGYLSIVISSLQITPLVKKQQLFCMECCNMPIYANTLTGPCQQCDLAEVPLRLNPLMIGPLHDETGTLVPAKTLWSDTAYTQLLGRSPAIMARLAQPVDKVKPQEYKARMRLLGEIEDRVAWLRLTVVVGWRGDETGGGRLCVLGVRGD